MLRVLLCARGGEIDGLLARQLDAHRLEVSNGFGAGSIIFDWIDPEAAYVSDRS